MSQAEISTLRREVQDMLEAAEAAYQDAAAMHSMGKVGHHGGRISALKSVLAAMDEHCTLVQPSA